MSFLKAVGVILTTIVIAASAWINFEYMAAEGTGRASLVLGVISVAFDLIKALLPVMIAAAVAQRAWLRAGVAGAFLTLFIAFGFVSALGFGESNKGDRVVSREGLAAELRDRERDLLGARQRLTSLPQSRPPGVIAAELAALKKDRQWDSSKGCTEATVSASRELCKAIDRLTGEVASAAEALVQAQKIERLDAEVRRLRERGAGNDTDPQASAIRRIVGHLLPGTDASGIRSGVVWLFATLVEGWSAFGLFLCGVRHRDHHRKPSADLHIIERASPPPLIAATEPAATIAADESRTLRMAAWAMQRLEFNEDGIISLDEAFADYVRVAAERGKDPLPEREFRKALIVAVVELDCEVWGNELRHCELARQPLPPAVLETSRGSNSAISIDVG